jgi:zinc/manganese transport system permease protein
MEILPFLILPFVAGLAITGIHTYLGVHIVERGVIFAGLALAQIAALGTMVALLAGYDVHSTTSHVWSLGFTVAGAAIFALTRGNRETRIPQEATLGIVYAVSAAAAILVMSQAPQGSEHLKDMLVGNILAVKWTTVIKMAVLYSLVGLFHFVFRGRFLAISLGQHTGTAETVPNLKSWDFLFYTSLGFVVTSSVPSAGVLLVFSYLIVPPVAAMLFANSIGKRLAIAWSIGALVTALGVLLSFKLDLPAGVTIVCTFGIALSLMAVARMIFKPNPG